MMPRARRFRAGLLQAFPDRRFGPRGVAGGDECANTGAGEPTPPCPQSTPRSAWHTAELPPRCPRLFPLFYGPERPFRPSPQAEQTFLWLQYPQDGPTPHAKSDVDLKESTAGCCLSGGGGKTNTRWIGKKMPSPLPGAFGSPSLPQKTGSPLAAPTQALTAPVARQQAPGLWPLSFRCSEKGALWPHSSTAPADGLPVAPDVCPGPTPCQGLAVREASPPQALLRRAHGPQQGMADLGRHAAPGTSV